MTEYRYSSGALAADYGRAGIGIVLTAGPLIFVEAGRTVTAVLVALAVTFVVYAIRTACRSATRVWVDDDAIATRGVRRKRLSWRDMTGMRLNYYSIKRDGRAGWMQLRLTGPGGALCFESTLEGFTEIARRASAAAQRRGISLHPSTAANLRVLGVRGPEAS